MVSNSFRPPAHFITNGQSYLIKDFKHTVKLYYDILDKHKDNPTYAAQIHHIFMMRDAVRKTWEKEGNNYE